MSYVLSVTFGSRDLKWSHDSYGSFGTVDFGRINRGSKEK